MLSGENQKDVLNHFDNTITQIRNLGFEEPLNYFVTTKKRKILGVCVGFQIMGKSSEEGVNNGLGWIDAKTVALPSMDPHDKTLRLPHMGWNKIEHKKYCPILDNIGSKEFYFLHSFQTKLKNPKVVTSVANYKYQLVASVRINNIFGIQFHPEKSHLQGQLILENFAKV